ncbi:uncharacterized protein LOC103516041 isoform X1 [Diaphorina citri]|uniref:Uncharacterized protein LOC103516041 isoform X1 n=1 Tax=Diaphorina citri TaxID=121845 RepID=A0A1S4EJM2_DIACI|nr:uncharacterized protein LOC103516041 isoform X1 [Diaphorina citri]XP_026684361.1 uncharacterized protein LOC103516041 isoform X1 [Diaphorina citri]KAI5699644.1 hypothetical protein M8J75_006282 [Diaphorina citri]KAI5732174.1 hypothetical protein M8J77_022697 [Diaphorina citri]
MNLLIRKNFHSEGGGGGGGSKDRGFTKVSGTRHRKGVHGKRSRETGGYSMMEEHHSYRTHIFLSPSNVGQENEESVTASKPSYAFIKWAINGIKRKSSGTGRVELGIGMNPQESASSSQVSFDRTSGRPGNYSSPGTALEPISKAEPVTFANLDRDCFIIPIATANRFLPEGVHIANNRPNILNVLEVEDPKLCVLIHLMTNFEPIDPILESPLAIPMYKQKATACDLLNDIAAVKCVKEGILLATIEKDTEFPFITYYVINNTQNNPIDVFNTVRAASLKKFDPTHVRYTAEHTFDLFNEVAIIARPPLQPSSRKPHSPSTGYIVTVYKVFEGDDNERFEQNWLYWTGARMLYRYLPKSAGLRRITLHKSASGGDKLYLLMCECANLLDDLSAAAKLLPALRARLCGYTALYRVADLI